MCAGDCVVVVVKGLSDSTHLSITAGFLPTWSSKPTRQEIVLTEGTQAITFDAEGPVYLRHIGQGESVKVRVQGGKPLALWHRDKGWQVEDTEGAVPWVQYLSERIIITLPRQAATHNVIDNPAETFASIEQILDWYDELSGRTEPTGLHQPCRNRIHFLTDIWASDEDRELFYMYACDGFIAMLPENTGDLVEPAGLKTEWAIWHELGHMYQPFSWTWDAHVEVNVNLWSLLAQERFGLASRLDEEPEHRETAVRLLADGQMDASKEGDPFVHLVMLERLRDQFGWDLYVELNRRYRANPLGPDASDAQKIATFCREVQQIAGADLTEFFADWGLQPPLPLNALAALPITNAPRSVETPENTPKGGSLSAPRPKDETRPE